MNIIEKIKRKIERNIRENSALLNLLERLPAEGFEVERANVSVSFTTIDIDRPNRKDVEAILRNINGGKWDKSKAMTEDNLHYTTREEIVPGFKLRLWCAEPPGSCKLVEEEIEVPEQPAIPAHKEIRKRLVCTPTEEQEAVSVS